MAYNNISKVLTPEEKQKILSDLNTLKSDFNFLINLTPKERKALHKKGLIRSGYVTEVFNAANANQASLPPSFNLAEFSHDVELEKFLAEFYVAIKPFWDGLESTLIAVGAECLKQSDTVYGYLKVEGAKSQNQALNSTLKRIKQTYRRTKKEEISTIVNG